MLRTKYIGMAVLSFTAVFLFISQPLLHAAIGPVDTEYKEAAACYHSVKTLPEKDQSGAKWRKCINLFEGFSKKHSKSEFAPKALYSAGLAYRGTYAVTKNESDARDAIRTLEDLVRMYPKNSLADDALYNIGLLKKEALSDKKGARSAMYRIVRWYPDGDMLASAEDYLEDSGAETEDIRQVHPISKYIKLDSIDRNDEGPDKETVTLNFSGPVKFKESQTSYSIPGFDLYILELEDTFLSRMLDTGYNYVGKNVIRELRPSQISQYKSEINLVIKKDHYCKADLEGSVIEVACAKGKAPSPAKSKVASSAPPAKPAFTTGEDDDESEAVADEDSGKKLAIVIDAGHGGEELGAEGPGDTREKDVVLQIAKRLGWQLRHTLGANVYYTRIDDSTVSLDSRNKIAKSYNADLFISVHANAAESPNLDGYQTFYLNNATDEASRKLAAIENAQPGKNIDDVEKIVLTLMQNINTEESRLLGESIHSEVLSGMSSYGLKDRGMKSALFYVLVGAECPAVLIETSFISNPKEETRLKDPDYQEKIAKSIADGIKDYLLKSKML